MQAQLQQAQRMEAVAGLASGAANDVDRVLHDIGKAAEALQQVNASDVRAHADLILRAKEQGVALVHRLLALSSRQATHPVVLSLGNLVRELLPVLEQVTPPNVSVDLNLEAPGWIFADPAHVEQALLNVVANAGEAMPRGGTVRIGLECGPCAAGGQAVVRLSVSDRGRGMSEAVRTRIFEPFYSTKPRGQGTGLGLTIVQRLMAQAGGTVSVLSNAGRGTRVDLRWPAAERSGHRAASRKCPALIR